MCCAEIDIEEARFFLSDAREQVFQIERGYMQGAEVAAPSVVSVNTAVASIAINEVAIFCSGLRPPNAYVDLDLLGSAPEPHDGWITLVLDN